MNSKIPRHPSSTDSGAQELFEEIRREGEAELARPASSLWWSGIAAGMSISTSVLGQAILELWLPEARWAHLIASFGYSLGFLIVVLGHMQLFTENTITTVLPILQRRELRCVAATARLWSIVLLANMVGCAMAAGLAHLGIFSPELLEAMLEVSHHGTGHTPAETFRYGIPAGFLVAAMVWTSRMAEGQQFWVVLLMTWAIAAGGFTHVVAGTVEVFLIVFAEGWPSLSLLWRFTLPALLGNVVGGTLLFALIAYAQVKKELHVQAP